jgi:HK97 family phage prohead protease
MTSDVLREQAAAARRDALRSGDTDSVGVSRSLAPIDVGISRSVTVPATLHVELMTRDKTKRWCPVKRQDVDCEDCIDQCDECSTEGDNVQNSKTLPWYRRSLDRSDADARIHLTGVASLTGVPYEMWDAFGPYTERISPIAFAESINQGPDTAFLANHEGLTMARTAAGSLRLSPPLNVEAWLNPERRDVQDLVIAIRDGDIDQMSFGATLEEGQWSEDFTEFEMLRLNLHCGDVSAVNFGANPYTSISARSRNVLADIGRLPDGTARSVLRALERRFSLPSRTTGTEVGAEGRSIALVRSALLAEEEF